MTDEILEKAHEIKNEQKTYNDILKKLSEQSPRIYSYNTLNEDYNYSERIPKELISEMKDFCNNKLKELEDEFDKL